MRRTTNDATQHVESIELEHGVVARIHLVKATGTFQTQVSGHGKLEDKDLVALRERVKGLTIVPPHTEYTWVPVIEIRHAVSVEDVDRYSYRQETATTEGLAFKRLYYGRKTRGSKVYEAAWPKDGEVDVTKLHAQARESDSKIDLAKDLPQSFRNSGYGYSGQGKVSVLPYTEERWAKVQKFNANLRAEARRRNELLTETPLDVIDGIEV